VSRYSGAVLEALAIAGAEWEALHRGGCGHPEHGRPAILVSSPGEADLDPPRCGCGAERPVQLRVVIATVADRVPPQPWA
jgi:hypothetical protein